MSFSVDQFMQVKCKFQLTSESESAESIHLDNEKIRLCTSINYGRRSILIVMVCSNETNNNHIVAYFIENPTRRSQLEQNQNARSNNSNTLSQCETEPIITSLLRTNTPPSTRATRFRSKQIKPKIVVKQIYYHNYNEDIVAISLSETGHKLVVLNASSTIYIIPIRNILFDLPVVVVQQSGSSPGKSMDFYDASLLNICSLNDPVAVAYWESLETNRSYVIVASAEGKLSFLSVDDKREKNLTKVDEPIRSMVVVRDKFSFSLLITCTSYNQYRITLELIKQHSPASSPAETTTPTKISHVNSSTSILTHDTNRINSHSPVPKSDLISPEHDLGPPLDKKPIPIKLHSNQSAGHRASAVLQRVFVPSNRYASQTSLLSQYNPRDRSLPLIFKLPSNMIGVIDVLGISNNETPSSLSQHNTNSRVAKLRLLRFHPSDQYCFKPQKPVVVCKLHLLDPDELITHVVLTGRFVAIATDRNRCLINSRNCCELKNATTSSSSDLDPLIKEIAFGNEERIISLMKSPTSNDPDNVIESLLLMTDRSIYSIEARQSCREMFINLIDSHLAIKRPLELPIINSGQIFLPDKSTLIFPAWFQSDSSSSTDSNNQQQQHHHHSLHHQANRKNSESSLLIDSFLSHRGEVYETICYESKAFSKLFKLDLNNLYEAYGDRLLQRDQFELANRFYQLAKLGQAKVFGKYLRMGLFINQQQSSPSSSSSLALLVDTVGNPNVSKPFKQSFEAVFIEFLNNYLAKSSQNGYNNSSPTLWLNYINFYLNYLGELDELETDILSSIDSDLGDCRMAIALYKAIQLDEMAAHLDTPDRSSAGGINHGGRIQASSMSTRQQASESNKRNKSRIESNHLPPGSKNKVYNLTQLFGNEFLLKLLERTLDLVPQADNLEALVAMF